MAHNLYKFYANCIFLRLKNAKKKPQKQKQTKIIAKIIRYQGSKLTHVRKSETSKICSGLVKIVSN
jgi:hypothetical protein